MDAEDSSSSDHSEHRSSEKSKKGQPWSEEEHRAFLSGLKKLGRGNWRGISKFFVPSRTPTQVASHAQKHFMRLQGATKRKSRFTVLEHHDLILPHQKDRSGVSADQPSPAPATISPFFPFTMPFPPPPLAFGFPPPPFMCNPQFAAFAAAMCKMGFLPPIGLFPPPFMPQLLDSSDGSETHVESDESLAPSRPSPCKPEPLHVSKAQNFDLLELLRTPVIGSRHVELVPSAHSAFTLLHPIKGC